MFGLTPYSSDDEVARVLKENGVRLQSRIGGDPYPLSWHYESYVLDSINTLEDAWALCDQLDRECNEHRSHKSGCAKANRIRQWLGDPRWASSPERIRCAIAACRTACDWSHETYSFALRKQYRTEK